MFLMKAETRFALTSMMMVRLSRRPALWQPVKDDARTSRPGFGGWRSSERAVRELIVVDQSKPRRGRAGDARRRTKPKSWFVRPRAAWCGFLVAPTEANPAVPTKRTH